MEFDAIRDNVTAALMEVEHNLAPLMDAADRMRGELIGRGWSAAGAERMAVAWYLSMLGTGR